MRSFGLPEVIEVEPIVRRIARVMLQPAGEAHDRIPQVLFASTAFHCHRVGERLEVHVVAVAAAVQAEAQNYRHVERGCELPRRQGKRRRAPEEIAEHDFVAGPRPHSRAKLLISL
jgi:hypothetical protein